MKRKVIVPFCSDSLNFVLFLHFSEASKRPRRSTRPSVLKMYGITELSEAFGIPLDSDSESDQEFAPPPKENQSGMFERVF